MPRVLRIINRLNLGGPTFNAAYLSKYLSPEFETLLVSGQKDDSEESSEFIVRDLGLEPVYIPNMHREISFTRDWQAYRELVRVIKEFKPDIIHTHAAKAGTLGRIAAWQCKVPVVVHTFHGHVFHSYFSPLKTRLYIAIERFLAKKSTRIVAISKSQKEELANRFHICNENKISIIPLGFNLDRFREQQVEKRDIFRNQHELDADEIAIAIVGRLVPIKNHTLFLKALAMILGQTTKKVRAFIVGDGEDRLLLEQKATELNMEYATPESPNKKASLVFTSWIKDIDLVYAGVDIVAMSSLNEGTPVSLIEAQAANKPIVSTRVGGIQDIVVEGKTALLSESGDVEMFALNLLQVIENNDVRSILSGKGADTAIDFHYTRLVKDMSDLYKELLREAKAK